MDRLPVKNVVIAGGGTAGWLAAAALSKQLGELLNITLVESEQIGTIGVGEASIPPMRIFHKLLGIDEQAFMRATSATFKLGIRFDNWARNGDQYIHSFGKMGKETWLGEFQHFWLRAQRLGIDYEFGDYCYELQAAREGRFATSEKSNMNYAYHLDSSRYARFLRQISEELGVKRIEGKIDQVRQDPDNGMIRSLELESGQSVKGDLFIDCTGFRGLLIEQTLHTGYEDWSHWLLCDRALAVQTESESAPPPYTLSSAHSAGWRWQIPLQHRAGNGLVYSSQHLSDDQAESRLLDSLSGKAINDPRLIPYRTGRRLKVWNKNCVALGLSSGFVEPLESTSIHLVTMGITRLMQLFPHHGMEPSLIRQYNDLTRDEIEKIRDFIMLHYHATEREDSSFWRTYKNMDIPDTLAHRLELFRRNGFAWQAENELFRVDSWTQVMLGQRIVPEHYHPVADVMSEQQLRDFMTKYRSSIAHAVEKLPDHQTFIKKYCAKDP